jgi:hypothetical protein
MRLYFVFVLFLFLFQVLFVPVKAQTPVPNGDFESWTSYGSYENPQYWDTPNQVISFALPFGTKVVTKSTDHESGTYSARLESKQLTYPSIIVPGVVTLGTLTINIFTQTFSLTGGVPIHDIPDQLTGFYKYLPKGGDSCAIGIGLTQWNGTKRDSVGIGAFTSHDTVNIWTPFTAQIYYSPAAVPDTFDILAITCADSTPTAGTVLFIDNLSLHYSVGIGEDDPAAGIKIYQDRELHQILVYFDLSRPETITTRLFNMIGQPVAVKPAETMMAGREILDYSGYPEGVYLLEILHGGKKYCRKFVFNN